MGPMSFFEVLDDAGQDLRIYNIKISNFYNWYISTNIIYDILYTELFGYLLLYFALWPNRDRLRCWISNRLMPKVKHIMKRILIRINAIIIGFGGISDGIGSWLISNWHRLPARPGGHWQCFTFVIDVRRQIPFLKKIAGIEIREIHLWNSPLTSIGLAYSIAFTKMHWRWNCISWTESISLASSSRTFYCQACLTTARFCKSKTFMAY